MFHAHAPLLVVEMDGMDAVQISYAACDALGGIYMLILLCVG